MNYNTEKIKTRTIELLNILSCPNPSQDELIKILYNKKNEKSLLELPIDKFFQTTLFMKPQKYGFLIENRLRKDLGYDKRKDNNSGDACNKNGKSIEFKGSVLTNTNSSLNIRQIRQWQQCDYVIYIADMRVPTKPDVSLFQLSHSDMEYELGCCDAQSSHGTQKSNEENSNIELSITIKVNDNDENFTRWNTKYKIISPWHD